MSDSPVTRHPNFVVIATSGTYGSYCQSTFRQAYEDGAVFYFGETGTRVNLSKCSCVIDPLFCDYCDGLDYRTWQARMRDLHAPVVNLSHAYGDAPLTVRAY